jgi:hypothetical protein
MENNIILEKIPSLKYIKLGKGSKKPLEGWSEEKNLYTSNSVELKTHIEGGNNYGVLTGNGVIVIDIDEPSILENIKLPETFQVKTSKGYHFYYKSDLGRKIILKNDSDGHVGEVQSKGQYVVGPNSIHETGCKYEVINDIELTYLSEESIHTLFKEYIPPTLSPITTTTTIIQSEDDSNSYSEKIDIFEDERFKKGDYSIKQGISFIKINDIEDFKVNHYIFNGRENEKYSTMGSVYRSPQKFKENEIRLDFVKGGIKAIKEKVKESSKDIYLIIYRASERLYSVENLEFNEFEELLEKTDEEIMTYFPEFINIGKSKLVNLRRNKDLSKVVLSLSEGIKDSSINDSLMGEILKNAIKLGLSNDKLQKIHETHYSERYDFQETQSQINYTKQLLGGIN